MIAALKSKIRASYKKWFKVCVTVLIIILAAAAVLLGIPRLFTQLYAQSRIYSVEDAPSDYAVAIVFGAGLTRSGEPTAILQDRVAAAADLYFAGKVKKLLMSGDNRFVYYNEPGAMRDYALKLGVPEDAIVLDYAGRRTYDTCYRAKAIFGVDRAILVTQDFHLPRALFTCNALGMDTVGVSADGRRTYKPISLVYWQARELPATLVALLDAWIFHPLPVLGTPEPIFPVETPTPQQSGSNH
ncbi:MAG TPA: ElyC/SanA/YdcF family protein [Longilinea sp.]|nr:ElyC/SanA/YdcF family protein [Longilinea sp.]